MTRARNLPFKRKIAHHGEAVSCLSTSQPHRGGLIVLLHVATYRHEQRALGKGFQVGGRMQVERAYDHLKAGAAERKSVRSANPFFAHRARF